MEKEHLLWKDGEKRRLLSTPIFSVDSVSRVSPEGKKGDFILLENPDWVSVIPLMRRADGEYVFVMVDQYRHGSGSVTREFPAGLTDDGETPKEAALRELMEETGMTGEVEEIASFNPNPAFMTNTQTFFLARDVRKVREQKLDDTEEIEVSLVPVKEVISSMGKGLYDNGIMMAAIGAFLRYWLEHPQILEKKE